MRPSCRVGLLVAGDERDVADLDPLGGGEERHREWIALDGGHDRAPVEKDTVDPGLFGRNPTARPQGPAPMTIRSIASAPPPLLFTVHPSQLHLDDLIPPGPTLTYRTGTPERASSLSR